MVRLLDAQGSCGGQRSGMERTTLHIVCGDSRSRAEQARVVFALGHHAEVYASLEELFERPPDEGIVLASAESEHLRGPDLIRRVVAAGIWLPIVLVGQEPEVDEVVAAIKAGAIDYLALPLEINSFAARLQGIREEAGQQASTRRREVEARRSIKRLSPRERQVLELLSAGYSNKEIARRLGISPRTVEHIVAQLCEALGIESEVTPHSFRHGLATEMVRRRVRESTVQTILGHASPQTTRIYVHKTALEVAEEYQDAFGPYRPPRTAP